MTFISVIIAGFIALAPVAARAETVSIDPPSEPVAVASPSVDITLTASPTSIAPGQAVTYALTITNGGDTSVTNLSARYDLPAGFTFVDGTSPSALKKLGTLAPNASITKTFTLRVSDAATTGRVPLEVLVDADEFDLNETIAVVDVTTGKVLGAETLVETGTSPISLVIVGLTTIVAGYVLRRRVAKT